MVGLGRFLILAKELNGLKLGYGGEQAFLIRIIGHEKVFPSVLIFNRAGLGSF